MIYKLMYSWGLIFANCDPNEYGRPEPVGIVALALGFGVIAMIITSPLWLGFLSGALS